MDLLFVISAGLLLLTSGVYGRPISNILHFQKTTPPDGITSLGPGWPAESEVSCAISCMNTHNNCSSFVYNTNTRLCTPVSLTATGTPFSYSFGDTLYQTITSQEVSVSTVAVAATCNESAGFNIRNYGSATACVGVFSAKVDYTTADSACKTKGAYLASAKTLDKVQILRGLCASYLVYNESVWLGCDDLDVPGTFVWKDDGGTFTYQTVPETFAPSQPDNLNGTEHCVVLSHINYPSCLLDDKGCETFHYYVCETKYP